MDNEEVEIAEYINRMGLNEGAAVALNEIIVRRGYNRADAVNRAVQMYAFTLREQIYTKETKFNFLGITISKFFKVIDK